MGSGNDAFVRELAHHEFSPGSIHASVLWVEFAVGSRLASTAFLRVFGFPPSGQADTPNFYSTTIENPPLEILLLFLTIIVFFF